MDTGNTTANPSENPGEITPAGAAAHLPDIRRPMRRPAEADIDQDDPMPDIRFGLGVLAAFFVIFLGWAAVARVDSAVEAAGTIIVTSSLQEVQHKQGGIVQAIHVKEGDDVQAGQDLVDLAGDDTAANADTMVAQFIDLKAKEARLEAEQAGRMTIDEPAEFATLDPSYRPLIESAMSLQRNTLIADRHYKATQLSVLGQRGQQTTEQIGGARDQMDANLKRQQLIQEELQGVRDLNAKGYAPMTRVRELEEQLASLQGDYGALQAQVAQSKAQIGETQMQAVSVDKQFLDQVLSDLNDTQTKLKGMIPQLQAALDAQKRLHIRAPVAGKVMGLTATTVGGVIAPGQKIMDIVPTAAPLVIKAMIAAKDGDDVHPGQVAQVHFTSVHTRAAPILNGKVLDVSGDTFTDEQGKNPYYTARVEISPETMQTLSRLTGKDALKPGLPVEVIVPQRRRTVLQYLLEPLNQSLWKTFREQ